MPSPVTLNIGQTVVIHSNPENAQGSAAAPNSSVQWTSDNPNVSLAPSGLLTELCTVTALSAGTANITMSAINAVSATITAVYQVIVSAGLFTQFAPTNDPPVTPNPGP